MQSINGTDQQSKQNRQQNPPQWRSSPSPVQYPAMIMPPHHMMSQPLNQYPHLMTHQYLPTYHNQYNMNVQNHQQKQFVHQQNDGSNRENKTVWIGDLHHWMDETYLHGCFASSGEVASVKVIRNKQTCLSEGYGFVEFFSHAAAEKVLQSYATAIMPSSKQPFRLNWATFSIGEKRAYNDPDLSIFVGDLAPDVTDSLLHETFVRKFPSVKAAKVVFDANTGRSKGYGFVRFEDDSERSQAMSDMNGVFCLTRPMRIGPATPRKSFRQPQYSARGGFASNGVSFQFDGDSTNTTIFVGGIDSNVADEDLRQPFSQYGDIVSIKIPAGKGCGFVQFGNRNNAEEALEKLNGTVIGKQTVRLSWGRNPANKASKDSNIRRECSSDTSRELRGDFGNQWNGGAYYGPQIYDAYSYALPAPHDPTMYAAAGYGAYPIYNSHQQQVS